MLRHTLIIGWHAQVRRRRAPACWAGSATSSTLTLLAALAVALTSFSATGKAQSPDPPAVPAEEVRLDRAVFRKALKRRGLTGLLELHLQDFPPTGVAEALLMKREIKLAEFADPDRSDEERTAAVAEANWILEKLIEDHSHDPRRFGWCFTLAHSLLYDEAEALITSVLYRGGSQAERQKLLALTARALATLTSLSEQLAVEYDRVDRLPIDQFEQLERSGHIEAIDRLSPRADYLMLWTLLYDSLPREDADRMRARRLNRIRTGLAKNRTILETPHDVSRIQVQALVLAGITERLLNDHDAARQYLNEALMIARRLADRTAQERVRWAVTLAQVELIRNDRDDGRFDAALNALSRFRRQVIVEGGENFGLQVVAALLERSIGRARADAAEQAGRTADAARYRDDAWRALARMAQRHPDRKDEIYTTLYAINGAGADLSRLDPFDRCALIAGLLFDAGEAADRADPRLERVIRVGERFLLRVRGPARPMVPEVLYNVAVAYYRQGRPVEAAGRFLEVARDHVTWDNALPAATYAVQLTADLYADSSLREHPELQRLYHDVLDVLVTHYTDTEAAQYWRFYYAQLLDELGEYDAAAAQYALVHDGHEHYLEGTFSRVRCLAMALRQFLGDTPEDMLNLQRRAAGFFAVQREFVSQAGGVLNLAEDSGRIALLSMLLARAKLIGAEVQVWPQIDRPAQALASLTGFEEACPSGAGLIGRAWRVRLLAYERLGRLEDAARAIPAYVTADPQGAGPTLQSLHVMMAADVKRLREEGDDRAAQRKADVALLLAEQIVSWAKRYDADASLADRRALTAQLAEANLAVGRYERARDLFGPCLLPGDESVLPEQAADLRVVFGYAEAQFHLGAWAAALPRFNALAVGLPPTDPVRWQSLLRDLQCRTELNHAPRDIIKVLAQQRYLYPELGGPALAKEFEKLQRENQRRVDAG